MIDFTPQQLERYSRHILLQDVGVEGQEKLMTAKILIVGVGGLGSPVALYLAAAGIGTIGIVDDDTVELSNLQRQIAHCTSDIDRMKVDSAAEKLSALNPNVTIRSYRERFVAVTASRLLKEYDFVIDATDNLPSKFLIADACHFARKPYSHAGILRFFGQTITVLPGETCCYRCIFNSVPSKADPESCAPEGPLGVLPGVIGSIQATEAIKYFLGCGNLLTDRLLTYDALAMNFRVIAARKNENCPLCGTAPTIHKPGNTK